MAIPFCRGAHGFAAQAFAAVLSLCVFVEQGIAQALSGEAAALSGTDTSPSNLPICINSESDIADIGRVQKESSKTPSKYNGYRKTLDDSAGLELAARLTYAETLAANCPAQADAITDLIASVIGSRIRIRNGDVDSVVFQRDQFASSLNIYSESRYRDFLCPNDVALWKKSIAKMRVNLEGAKPSAAIPGDAVNYYLYRHSDRFKAPDWKLEEVLIAENNAENKIGECIRVFRNPAWK